MKFNFRLLQNNNKQKKIINIFLGIFCIGLLIVLLFNKEEKAEEPQKDINPEIGFESQEIDNMSYCDTIEKKLEKEFAKIEGVGRVEVIVTMRTNGEIVLNKDMPYNNSSTIEKDDAGGTRESNDVQQQEATVLIKKSDGSEEPMIIKELLPEVSGILIIAEGGDSFIVKNNLINASKVLLDLPAHKIEVMKRVPD